MIERLHVGPRLSEAAMAADTGYLAGQAKLADPRWRIEIVVAARQMSQPSAS